MKPFIARVNQSNLNALLKHLQKEKQLITGRHLDMGEVCPLNPIQDAKLNVLCPDVLQVIKTNGYRLAGEEAISPDIVVTKGNIGIHADADSGLVALALLTVKPLTSSPSVSLAKSSYEHTSYLWTTSGLKPLKPGDMAIFDTDQEHAWFCSGIATFLCIPVRKQAD
jgi:hypothetical protein